jgi:uncharacterized metal-binding protein YceD (DUF177 family)
MIPLKGLKPGKHEFSFHVDQSFFEYFDDEEVSKSDVDIHLVMKKTLQMYDLKFSITGFVEIPCDRCLDEMELEVKTETNLYIKYGDSFKEIDDEVVVVPEDEGYFDLAPYIFEYIKLSFPIQKTHEEGECNPEMVDRIDSMTPQDSVEQNDPRWDALRNLSINN